MKNLVIVVGHGFNKQETERKTPFLTPQTRSQGPGLSRWERKGQI